MLAVALARRRAGDHAGAGSRRARGGGAGGPRWAPGVGYPGAAPHVDLHSIAKVKILGSYGTVPTDMHLKVTLQVKVLAVSGDGA